MKTFGKTVRDLREEKGLKLREAAAELKIDPSFLSRVEKGEKRPTREQVEILERLLKRPKNELVILYLSEKVIYELDGENLAIDAIQVAEKRIRYNSKKDKSTKKAR